MQQLTLGIVYNVAGSVELLNCGWPCDMKCITLPHGSAVCGIVCGFIHTKTLCKKGKIAPNLEGERPAIVYAHYISEEIIGNVNRFPAGKKYYPLGDL